MVTPSGTATMSIPCDVAVNPNMASSCQFVGWRGRVTDVDLYLRLDVPIPSAASVGAVISTGGLIPEGFGLAGEIPCGCSWLAAHTRRCRTLGERKAVAREERRDRGTLESGGLDVRPERGLLDVGVSGGGSYDMILACGEGVCARCLMTLFESAPRSCPCLQPSSNGVMGARSVRIEGVVVRRRRSGAPWRITKKLILDQLADCPSWKSVTGARTTWRSWFDSCILTMWTRKRSVRRSIVVPPGCTLGRLKGTTSSLRCLGFLEGLVGMVWFALVPRAKAGL